VSVTSVHWTLQARDDLTRIGDYIRADRSETVARDVVLRIAAAVEMLADFPQGGRAGRVRGSRELVIAGLPYLAVYRVRRSGVEILRVVHGAQQWP